MVVKPRGNGGDPWIHDNVTQNDPRRGSSCVFGGERFTRRPRSVVVVYLRWRFDQCLELTVLWITGVRAPVRGCVRGCVRALHVRARLAVCPERPSTPFVLRRARSLPAAQSAATRSNGTITLDISRYVKHERIAMWWNRKLVLCLHSDTPGSFWYRFFRSGTNQPL